MSGKLGAVIFDSCANGILSSYTIADIHSRRLQLTTPAGETVDPDKIVAYIGGWYSQTQIEVLYIKDDSFIN